MKEKLQSLLKKAYCPYSKFPVAAIVVMKDGTEFFGVNVEDASTRAGICAERNAITSAITAGYQKGQFQSLYVMVDQEEISTCCFVCRQLIVEFFEPEAVITCMNHHGQATSYTVSELCPFPFDQGDVL